MVSRADSKFLKDPKDVFWPKKEKTTEKKIYDEILDAGIEANGYLCKIQDNNRIPKPYKPLMKNLKKSIIKTQH